MVVAAMGNVIVPGELAATVSNVDTTSDAFDVNVFIVITDLAGTNILTIDGFFQIPVSGPGESGSMDWTTATATSVAGIDLTWDNVALSIVSTAGGVYVASIQVLAGSD